MIMVKLIFEEVPMDRQQDLNNASAEAFQNALIYGPDTKAGQAARNILAASAGDDQVKLADDMRGVTKELRISGQRLK
jgi:anti-sigma regulatory factor (Ser/Thr protein kinase)